MESQTNVPKVFRDLLLHLKSLAFQLESLSLGLNEEIETEGKLLTTEIEKTVTDFKAEKEFSLNVVLGFAETINNAKLSDRLSALEVKKRELMLVNFDKLRVNETIIALTAMLEFSKEVHHSETFVMWLKNIDNFVLTESPSEASLPVSRRVMTHLYSRKALIESCLKFMFEQGDWKIEDLIVIAIHLYGDKSEEIDVSELNRVFVSVWHLPENIVVNNLETCNQTSELYFALVGFPWRLKLTEKGRQYSLSHIEKLAEDAR